MKRKRHVISIMPTLRLLLRPRPTTTARPLALQRSAIPIRVRQISDFPGSGGGRGSSGGGRGSSGGGGGGDAAHIIAFEAAAKRAAAQARAAKARRLVGWVYLGLGLMYFGADSIAYSFWRRDEESVGAARVRWYTWRVCCCDHFVITAIMCGLLRVCCVCLRTRACASALVCVCRGLEWVTPSQ